MQLSPGEHTLQKMVTINNGEFLVRVGGRMYVNIYIKSSK